MKINLLLDLDGVVADFFSGFATYLNQTYNTNLDTTKEPISYAFKDWSKECGEIDMDEAVINWIKNDGFVNIPAYNGAKRFIETLQKYANVFPTTARIGDFKQKFGEEITQKIKSDTMKWVKNNNLPLGNVFFEHMKIDFCKENGISTLIEDKLETALNGAKEGINSIIIDRAWNHHPPRYKVYRAYNYQDAIYLVKKLSGSI